MAGFGTQCTINVSKCDNAPLGRRIQVEGGKTGQCTEPVTNFPVRLPADHWIVIDAEIEVFHPYQ
jgi:hypothetical protein